MNIPCVDLSAVDINPYNGKGEHGTCSLFTTNSEGDRRSPEELERTIPKIYVCDLCEKKYRTRSGLKYHSRNCILRPSTASDDESLRPSVADPTHPVCVPMNLPSEFAPFPTSSSVELSFFSVTTRRPSIKTSSFVLIGYTIMLVIIFYRISSIHIYH
jgi:hypothetical protein